MPTVEGAGVSKDTLAEGQPEQFADPPQQWRRSSPRRRSRSRSKERSRRRRSRSRSRSKSRRKRSRSRSRKRRRRSRSRSKSRKSSRRRRSRSRSRSRESFRVRKVKKSNFDVGPGQATQDGSLFLAPPGAGGMPVLPAGPAVMQQTRVARRVYIGGLTCQTNEEVILHCHARYVPTCPVYPMFAGAEVFHDCFPVCGAGHRSPSGGHLGGYLARTNSTAYITHVAQHTAHSSTYI